MPLFGPPNIEKLKAKRDVSGLIKALGYQKDASVRQSAADALGEIGDSQAVEPLIAALKDSEEDVRWRAAGALGKIGAPAVEPLLAVLKGSKEIVRRYVAEALGQIGDVRAIEPLIAMLKDSNDVVRWRAASALGKIGDVRAIEPLIAELKDSDRYVRWQAAEALGKIGDVRAIEPLIAELKDSEELVRWQAAKALGKIGTPAIEPLVAALKDSDRYVVNDAADVLEKLGWQPTKSEAGASYWIVKRQWDKCVKIGTPAIEPLIAALNDVDKNVSECAANALKKLGWQPTQDEAGAKYWIEKRQWDKCVEIGTPAVEPLIAALKDGFPAGFRAANALGKIGDVRAVEPLIVALKDDDKSVRDAAADALGQIGDARAVEPLIIIAFKDESEYVRISAAHALKRIGGPEEVQLEQKYWELALRHLQKMMSDNASTSAIIDEATKNISILESKIRTQPSLVPLLAEFYGMRGTTYWDSKKKQNITDKSVQSALADMDKALKLLDQCERNDFFVDALRRNVQETNESMRRAAVAGTMLGRK